MGDRGYIGREKCFGKRKQHVRAKNRRRNIRYETNLCFQHLKFLYKFNFIHTAYFATFLWCLETVGFHSMAKWFINAATFH